LPTFSKQAQVQLAPLPALSKSIGAFWPNTKDDDNIKVEHATPFRKLEIVYFLFMIKLIKLQR
jgi:hypothetical protein